MPLTRKQRRKRIQALICYADNLLLQTALRSAVRHPERENVWEILELLKKVREVIQRPPGERRPIKLPPPPPSGRGECREDQFETEDGECVDMP